MSALDNPMSTRGTQALATAATDEAHEVLRRSLDATPEVDPLDALRSGSELVNLLAGWRWQAVHAARVDGATWEQIGSVTDHTAAQARAAYIEAIDRLERRSERPTQAYRKVI